MKQKIKFGSSALHILLIISMICLNSDLSAGSEFYRWTDENGVTNITNQPQDSAILKKDDLKVWDIHEKPLSKATVKLERDSTRAEGQYVVPFKKQNGAILVDVLLNDYIPAKMQVDTGANVTVINVNLLHQLDQPSQANPFKGKVTTAAGVVDASGIVIKKVSLGEAVKKDVMAIYSDEKYDLAHCDGLLGMSFLADFKITIDYNNNIMILNKP